jgi:hypothetical protein
MLSTIGLVLIVAGWLVQLYFVMKGFRTIQPLLLLFYGIGVVILIIDGISAGITTGALLNTAVVAIVAVVLGKMVMIK